MVRTIDQRLAEAEALLQKRKAQHRRLLTRQKILVGGAVLSAASHDSALAEQLVAVLRQKVSGRDLKDIEPILAQLASPPVDVVDPLPVESVAIEPASGDDARPATTTGPTALAGLANVARRTTGRAY